MVIELRGGAVWVQMRVVLMRELVLDFYLVLFDAKPTDAAVAVLPPQREPDSLARQLEGELERMKAHLRETAEQHEASTEELKASKNPEFLSQMITPSCAKA
jgi:two-component system CheB/CheR fusion protein